jgi:hypothetical protein
MIIDYTINTVEIRVTRFSWKISWNGPPHALKNNQQTLADTPYRFFMVYILFIQWKLVSSVL